MHSQHMLCIDYCGLDNENNKSRKKVLEVEKLL